MPHLPNITHLPDITLLPDTLLLDILLLTDNPLLSDITLLLDILLLPDITLLIDNPLVPEISPLPEIPLPSDNPLLPNNPHLSQTVNKWDPRCYSGQHSCHLRLWFNPHQGQSSLFYQYISRIDSASKHSLTEVGVRPFFFTSTSLGLAASWKWSSDNFSQLTDKERP